MTSDNTSVPVGKGRRFVAVALVAALCAGCGVPAWQTARASIRAAQTALDPIESMVPDGNADAAVAFETTRGLLAVGVDMTNAWERDGETPLHWHGWVSEALRWSAAILDVLKGIPGCDIPEPVLLAIGGLQLLLPVITGIAGG